VWLPDLPPGVQVAFDTETFGLYPDGDPGGDSGDPGSPPSWISAASIAYRDPDTGHIASHAWGFDQGPCPDKPGRVRRPREGGGVEQFDPAKMLATLAKYGYGSREFTGADFQYEMNKKGTKVRKTTVTNVQRWVPWTWQEAYRSESLESWLNLVRWLRDRPQLVMHNAKFDMTTTRLGLRPEVVARNIAADPELYLGIDPGDPARFSLDLDRLADGTLRPVRGVWDTMLVQSFFDPRHPVALKKTGKRLWGDRSEAEQQTLLDAMKRQGVGLTKRYDLTPWPVMEPYAAKDTVLTLLLEEHQRARIASGDHPPCLWEQIDKEFGLMRVLYRMEGRGVAYDVAGSESGARLLRESMSGIEARLPFDPSKLASVKQFYFAPEYEGGLGIVPLKTTEKTGQPCLDEAQVRILVNQGRPWAAEYDEWSHCRSALGKWYDGWAKRTGADGRLRTVFKQCVVAEERAGARTGGTISGRLAVGRVQLQAIPHNHQLPEPVRHLPVRSLIGARPGHCLYEMDLPQGEVRIATVVVNCSAMWDVIDSGADLHGENAKRIFGIGEDDERYEAYRGVAKRIVFGTLYGAGVRTLRQQILEFTGLDYSEDETREAKQAFERTFPEFPRVARQIQRKADRALGGPGYVRLIDGRRRWFGPEEYSHKAFNAVIQGGLAQTGKTWMIEVEQQLPGIQVLAIHDSIVVEVPDSDYGEHLARQVAAIGKEVYERDYGVRGRTMYFDIVPKRWGHK